MILLASTSLAAAAHAQSQRGIYVVAVPYVNGSATNKQQARSYSRPYVDGVVIPLHWSYIEPVAPGHALAVGSGPTDPFTGETFCPKGTHNTNFCWQELDEQLEHIHGNQKLSLSLAAGGFTPAWLTAPPYSLTTTGPILYASHNGTGADCFTINLPLATPSFATAYIAAMQAIAARLAGFNALSRVSMVKLSGGLNTVTDEFHIDAATISDACLTDVTPIWQSLGYTPAATQSVWETIAEGVNALFPQALPGFALLENSFDASPLIDDSGVIFTPSQYDKTPSLYGTLLLDRVLAAYVPGGGAQGILGATPVSVQWDGLAPADQQTLSTIATHTIAAGVNGAMIGFQTNEMYGTAGSSCGTAACATATANTTQCYGTATCVYEFESMLDNGINPLPGTNLQASFIEVWAPDAANPCLQPALVNAHNTLTGDSIAPPKGC